MIISTLGNMPQAIGVVRLLRAAGAQRTSATVGLLFLVVVAIAPQGALAKPAAGACLAALAFACLSAAVDRSVVVPARMDTRSMSSRAWVCVPVLLPVVIVFAWVTPKGGFARGDIGPPAGTAWTHRVFDAWSWDGSSLGSPHSPIEAPLALVQRTLSFAGGPPELAIAIWYFLLFLLASLSMFLLCRTLRLSGASSALGAAAYVLNPYVVSTVGPNPAFLSALGAMPLAMLIVLGVGTRTSSTTRTMVLVGLSAPILGYVYLNPPLLFSVVGAAALGVAGSWALDGRAGAHRAAKALALGAPLIIGCCLYWIIPAVLQIQQVNAAGLSDTSSWAFTEVRSTLPNALWLNTFWGWKYPEYFPFAAGFEAFPAHLVRYLPVGVGFAALARYRSSWRTRLSGVLGIAALTVMLLSTGTRSPGNLIFDRLYALPFGWLLREPGRFLNVAAFCTCLLIAIAIEPFAARLSASARRGLSRIDVGLPWLLGISILLLTPGLPILTGAVVDGGVEAPTKTVTPGYWREMFDVMNSDFAGSTVMLLPLNDFYQVPFQWYYGTDAFVARSLKARVVSPVDESYFAVSKQVSTTAKALTTALRTGDRQGVASLARALGVDLVLLRGDVRADLPQRQISDPARLKREIAASGAAREVLSSGPLTLLRIMDPEPALVQSQFATIETEQPDVSVLQAIGPERRLVSSSPLQGAPHVLLPPPPLEWTREGPFLVARQEVERAGPVQLMRAGAVVGELSAGQRAQSGSVEVELSTGAGAGVLTWRQRVTNAFDALGGWSAYRDCQRAPMVADPVESEVVPAPSAEVGDAIRLSTDGEVACIQRPIQATAGPLRLSYSATSSGAAPRTCVWQSSLGRCASVEGTVTKLREGVWSADSIVNIAAETGPLSLFLYADRGGASTSTVQYSDVRLTGVGEALPAAVSSVPGPPARQLAVTRDGFSAEWAAARGDHVRVDGLRNGWLLPPSEELGRVSYRPSRLQVIGRVISLLVMIGCTSAAALACLRKRRLPRRPERDPSLLKSLRR
jgi:hypothetical protein